MILLNAIPEVASTMSVESLISDLAFILILGSIVTVLFKWIKQPVVLGYIVAGFLASPNFTPLPSVTTEANIEFWAQIGIVVLLFSIGLEFSFKKLIGVGGSAVVTALIIVIGMMATGFIIGHLMGFSNINSLFLGGMLSMSSTTIIIKAFNDLGLKQQKFAGLVFAVLIVEDLFAVLMMVILSSIAINNSVEGAELLMSIAKLVFFLVIWFMVGVYALPSALGAVRRFLNSETLLIVSMGLCLGMAVFSVFCGFSLALGAFVMGSILAGTSYAERIERVTMSVKDLFGSVFFISVGMMVQPTVIVEYWGPILILSSVVIVGMIIFGTTGMLVTGQTLRVAIESGFALTQIGEFAFIIASLGMSLGVLNPTIYPIVVAVSVLTTFTTPYFIRMSPLVATFVENHLPAKLKFLINRYCEDNNESHSASAGKTVWMAIIRRYLWRIVLYAIILIAIILIATTIVLPWAEKLSPDFGKPVVMIATLLSMSPFLLAMSLPTSKKDERRLLAEKHSNYRAPLIIMSVFRILIVLAFVVYLFTIFYSIKIGILGGIIVMTLILGVFTRQLRERMRKIETKFMNNLNERELRQTGRNNNLVSNLHLAFMHVGYGCPFVGERLMDSPLRSTYGVSVVNIQRGNNTMTVPSGHTRLFPGDIVGVIGNDEQIQKLLPVIDKEQEEDFSQNIGEFKLRSTEVGPSSPLIGQTITTADIRKNYSAHIVAIQRNGEYINNILDTPFEAGDVLWVVADKAALKKLNNI